MSGSAEQHSYSNQRSILLAIFGLAILLQVGLTPRQSLWTDEIFSLAIATGHSLEHPAAIADAALGDFQEPFTPVPRARLQRYVRHEQPAASPARVLRAVLLSDTSPPLYYLLLYGWTLCFGSSDLALRLFSVLWSLASFPLLASIARRTTGWNSVIPACFLFAVSPAVIYFGNEARMYSLLVFLVLATVWVSLILTQEGGTIGRHVLWIVTSAAGFLTHYFFLFPWLAVVGYVLLRPGKLRRRDLLIAVCFAGFAILPWYLQVPDQMHRWRVTKDWLKLRPQRFNFTRIAIKQFLQFFLCAGWGMWFVPLWSSIAALVLFACLIVRMLWKLSLRAITGCPLLLWLWFIAASAGPLIMDAVQQTYSSKYPRYALAALPAASLIAGLALSTLARRTRLLALVLIAAVWSPSLLGLYRKHSRGNQPFRQVARVLHAAAAPSDVILVHSIPAGVLGVARYTDTPAGLASWIEQLGPHHLPESLNHVASAHSRLWYIRIEHRLQEPRPELDWLRQNATLFSTKHIEEITIMEFHPMNGHSF